MNKRHSVPADFGLLETLSDAEYCARNDVFVCVKNGKILLAQLPGGRETRVTAGGQGERGPRFSKDGTKILFISGGQIWTVLLDTMEYRQVTHMRFGAFDPQWSPDGSRILFSSGGNAGDAEDWLQEPQDEAGNARYLEAKAREPVVIEDLGYKFDGMGFATPEHTHLWITDAAGGSAKRLTGGDYDYLHAGFSPDGSQIAYISACMRGKDEQLGMDLFIMPAAGGEAVRLTKGQSHVSYPTPFGPLFTHDGQYIIGAYIDEAATEKLGIKTALAPVKLHRIALDGSSDVCIFPETPICHECVAFPYNASGARCYRRSGLSSDGRYVYFISGFDGECRIFKAAIYGEPEITLVAGGKRAFTGLDQPQDGKMLVSLCDESRPGEYWLMDEENGQLLTRLTCSNAFLDGVDIAMPREIAFDTLDGESRVHGWVLPPQGMEEGVRYPAILYVHGGPHPFYTYSYDQEMQCLAGAGFAVIFCNPRGSSSYGLAHENLDRAFDGSAYYDCLQAVETACGLFSWIDRDRIGITGGSYGGYMVNYAATHGSRFRACVTQRSIANELISYASADMSGHSLEYPNFEEFMVSGLKDSPVAYAERIRVPLLILHGTDDYRTPVEGAHQLFVAVKDMHPGLPVRMVLFPHTGHSIPGNMRLKLIYHREMIDWFTKYL
jgi:dipeptidyl aminopeptidase/acylaminoacyl peptidase